MYTWGDDQPPEKPPCDPPSKEDWDKIKKALNK